MSDVTRLPNHGNAAPPANPPAVLLSAFELRLLNEARNILEHVEAAVELEARRSEVRPTALGGPSATSYGRVAEAAEIASDAIFNVLNTMNAYRVQPIDRAIMENRPSPTEAS